MVSDVHCTHVLIQSLYYLPKAKDHSTHCNIVPSSRSFEVMATLTKVFLNDQLIALGNYVNVISTEARWCRSTLLFLSRPVPLAPWAHLHVHVRISLLMPIERLRVQTEKAGTGKSCSRRWYLIPHVACI